MAKLDVSHPFAAQVRLIMQLYNILDPDGRGYITREEAIEALPNLGFASAADVMDLKAKGEMDRLDKMAFFGWYTRCTPQLAAQVQKKYPELFTT